MTSGIPPHSDIPQLGKSAFKIALDLSPHPVLIHDSEMIVYVNEAAAKALLAGSPSDIVGKSILSIVHPDAHEAAVQRINMVFEEGHAMSDVPLKMLTVSGIVAHAEVNSTRIFDGGRPFALVSTPGLRYEG